MKVVQWFQTKKIRETWRNIGRPWSRATKQAKVLVTKVRDVEGNRVLESALELVQLSEEPGFYRNIEKGMRSEVTRTLADVADNPAILSALTEYFAKHRTRLILEALALNPGPAAAKFLVDIALTNVPRKIGSVGDQEQELAEAFVRNAARQGDLRQVDFLIEKLDSTDEFTFERARWYLREYGASIVDRLCALWKTGTERQRAAVANLLGGIADPIGDQIWQEALRCPSDIQDSAIETAEKSKLQHLLNLLNAPWAYVDTALAKRLGEIGDHRAIDGLINALARYPEDSVDVKRALNAIASRNPELRGGIEKSIESVEIERERMRAASAMAKIPETERVSSLYDAAKNGRTTEVSALLDLGVDPNSNWKSGSTALMAAALGPAQSDPRPLWRLDTIRLLLKRGADVNSQDSDGYTALWFAVFKGRTDIVSILISNGANPNLSPTGKPSPVDLARQNNFQEVTKVLTER
jgi:uncharacterized protein